jgi:2-polyprenyl-3-methyl-5-hydroxy-6-metoxy-1,4-benzoquinol methylase
VLSKIDRRVVRKNEIGVWAAGLRLGFRSLAREPVLGIKRLLLPASYWRYAEFRFALDWLLPVEGRRLLDVGSPKDLALMLAREGGAEVVGTDILESAVQLANRYAEAQGIVGQKPGCIHNEVQDGRTLPYASETFDAAFSISVLEHIPGDGDSAAVRQLVRVVKPGGLVVVTVPFDRQYRETFRNEPVYERVSERGEPVFFERHYDHQTLHSRLILPSGGELAACELWGERMVRMERLLGRLRGLRSLLSPFEAVFSRAFLHEVGPNAGQPMAAFLALRKPKV